MRNGRNVKEDVRRCKDVFIIEQLLIEQPPQMVELLLYLMKRVKVLERDVEHRDRRLEVLTRIIHQLKNWTENQAQPLPPEKTHDVSNLIGKPIILKQQWKEWRSYRPMNGLAEKTRRKPVSRVAKRSNKNWQGQGRSTSPKNGGAQEKTREVMKT